MVPAQTLDIYHLRIKVQEAIDAQLEDLGKEDGIKYRGDVIPPQPRDGVLKGQWNLTVFGVKTIDGQEIWNRCTMFVEAGAMGKAVKQGRDTVKAWFEALSSTGDNQT